MFWFLSIYTLVAFVIAIYVSIVLHELSHYIVIKMAGWQVLRFIVWPHRFQGHTYFGRVEYTTLEHTDRIKTWQPWVHSAPLYKVMVMSMIWMLMASLVSIYFVPFIITEVSDGIAWWVGFVTGRPASDGYKARCCLLNEPEKE